MPTLRKINSDLSRVDSPSVSKSHSSPVPSLRADAPQSSSKHQKKMPSVLEPYYGLSPKWDRKRKAAHRVTASPGALQLPKRPTKVSAKCAMALDSSVGDGQNNGDGNAPLPTKGQKRTVEHHSDIENEGDGSNEVKGRTSAAKHIFHDLRLSPENKSSNEEESVARGSSSRPARSASKPRDRSRSIPGGTSKACRSRCVSGEAGWLTSFHARNNEDSSSNEDDDDETDRKLKAINRCNWLTSPSRDDKLDFLNTISEDKDKLLQMLLWDIGFDFKLHPYQFEAARFVAGFESSFPLKKQAGANDDSSSSDDEDKAEDEAVREMMQFDEIGRFARTNSLHARQLKDRGMLLADEMGLGKTIEALSGAVLRNASKDRNKPTLIVTPQDGVQDQWLEAMLKSGVESARIGVIGESETETKRRGGRVTRKVNKKFQNLSFVFCTRYKIQSEMKTLFDYSNTAELQKNRKISYLFQEVPLPLIKKMKHEYNVDKGKERRGRNAGMVAPQDRVTRLIRNSFGGKSSLAHVFETVIIDECHFLRNVLAYWGLGAALLGAQSKRTILLSGTPYNNSYRDMCALMTFIDPRHEAAEVRWWEKNTVKGRKNDIIEAVSGWKEKFMLRRPKSILEKKLPPLERSFINVPVRPSELGIYEAYEAMFIKVLNQLQEDFDDSNRKAQNEMFEIAMSCMACMRMSLIHPILPGGREATIQFSPSRRHLLKREESKEKCVFCGDSYPTQAAEKYAAKKAAEVKEESDEDSFRQLLGLDVRERSDDNILEGDDEATSPRKEMNKDKEKGPILELRSDICHAAGSDCCHFAHERCIELFLEKGCQGGCPRCYDLASRIHVASSTGIAGKKIYCQEIGTTLDDSKGFTASAKIEKAVEWFQSVPKDEKAIILSFFKGTLDLIEGILTEELGVECCRYDGDIAKEKRSMDLKKFQTSKNCRALLASVQSGGVGLNITQANNVCFLDRWFNPQIHDQAESRCHRLGQTKDVKIAYMDTSHTVDIAMRKVNSLKEENAAVVLADGTSIGYHSTFKYNDLPGAIGDILKIIIAGRHAFIMENAAMGDADAPLLADDDSDIDIKIDEAAIERAMKKKKAVKLEDVSSTYDDDCDDGMSSTSVTSRTSFKEGDGHTSSCGDDSSPSDDELINRQPTFGVKSERKATKSATNDMSTGGNALLATQFAHGENGNGPPPSNNDRSPSDHELLNGEPTFGVKLEHTTNENTVDKKSDGSLSSSDDDLINCEPTFGVKLERKEIYRTANKTQPKFAGNGNGNGMSSSRSVDVVIDLSRSDDEVEDLPNGCIKSQRKAANSAVNEKASVAKEDPGILHDSSRKNGWSDESGTALSNICVLEEPSSTATGQKNPCQVAVSAQFAGPPFSMAANHGASCIESSKASAGLLSEEDEVFKADIAAAMKRSVEEEDFKKEKDGVREEKQRPGSNSFRSVDGSVSKYRDITVNSSSTKNANHPATVAPSNNDMREQRLTDASVYVNQVQMEFQSRPHIYEKFLEIMQMFKCGAIDSPGAAHRVMSLFRGNKRLILGFNSFLPEEHHVELRSDGRARPARRESGQGGTVAVTPGHGLTPPSRAGEPPGTAIGSRAHQGEMSLAAASLTQRGMGPPPTGVALRLPPAWAPVIPRGMLPCGNDMQGSQHKEWQFRSQYCKQDRKVLSVESANDVGISKGTMEKENIAAGKVPATADEHTIEALERELDRAIDINDFATVKSIHRRLKELRRKRN